MVYYDKLTFPINFSIESGDLFIEVEETRGIDQKGMLLIEYFAEERTFLQNIVFFSGSRHAWIGFNYDGRDIPNVVYVELDDGDGNTLHMIAETFTEFVRKLGDRGKHINEIEFE